MCLLLTAYNTATWKTFANAISLPQVTEIPSDLTERASLLFPKQKLSTLTRILSQLPPGGKILLAAVQAEHFLAEAIEKGNNIALAAQEWQEQTNALLTLHRQQRRQLQLFNLHQALANPQKFCKSLSEIIPISDYPAQPVISNLALLAGCQYLSQQPEMHALNTRLQATVLPLCDTESLMLDVSLIIQDNQENVAQLSAVRADRDQALQQLNDKQQLLTQSSSEHRHLQETLLRTEASLKTTSDERELILSELQLVQEQLEQYHLSLLTEEQKNKHAMLARDKQQAREMAKLESDLIKTKARAASAEYANQLLQQELIALQGSTLWRATGPVRALGRLVKKTDKERNKLLQDTALLLTSEYFDVDWYLSHYPDVAESKMNPAEHYLIYGAKEGRLPGPVFDGNWYLQHYPDVAAAGVNPVLHFIMFGQQEGRSSSPILLTNNSQNPEE